VKHIDPEHFFIREIDGVRLVTPKAATVFADHVWTPENIHYRSRVETVSGETVSQGFKKFMNLGQGPDGLRVDAADVINACVRGDAVATVKLDGSLLVRSVHQGKVLLRTRGAFGYQHQDNAHEIEECTRRYPRLLDPTYLPDTSLLFEWVSPSNVIILKYAQTDLILVGGVQHHDLRYLRLVELQNIAAHVGIELVEFFPLNESSWADLYATLSSDTEKEGYVIRINDEQTLVKVKCASYIAKHAFKYRMSTGRLIDMWFQAGRPSQSVFIDSLTRQFDEETIMWALPFITGFFRAVQAVEAHLDAVRQEVDRHRVLSRKDFAIQMRQQLSSKDFSLAMLFWDNKAVQDRLLRQLLEDELAAAQLAPPAVIEEEA
jgi:hypothetical protein